MSNSLTIFRKARQRINEIHFFVHQDFRGSYDRPYIKLGLKRDSPVQNPERLYREKEFLAYAILSLVVFILLLFIRIPL